MGLKDRFRIDELVKKGEKAIPRDEAKRIVVRKSGGKQIPPDLPKDEIYEWKKRKKENKPNPRIKPKRKFLTKKGGTRVLGTEKPFGSVPIKAPTIVPRTKEDLVAQDYIPTAEELAGFANQESFSGETSGRIERPVYDENELRKAKDLKVDELIKPDQVQKGDFVKRKLYTDEQSKLRNEIRKNVDLSNQINRLTSEKASIASQVQGLQSDVNALREQIADRDAELQAALARYNELLSDYQNSVIKGTKEGIERVSLTAQVKGLQAQKETLQTQLSSQQDIVKSLQNQQEIQQQVNEQQQQAVQAAADAEIEQAKQASLTVITNGRPQTQIKGTVAIAGKLSNKNSKPSHQVYWDDRRKGPKGILSGMKFDWFNVGTESVTLNVRETVVKKGKWLNGVPSKVIVPASPDGGSSPGIKSMNLSRGSTGKGTYETDIVFTNANTQETFVLKTHYWQARRRRKT
jgi:hypothetical protein